MKFKLKVFTNKRNGQLALHPPKKIFEKFPKNIEIKVPMKFIKKHFKKVE